MSEATFTLEIDDKDHEVFMSYGLLDEICRLCGGDPDATLQLALDDDLRSAALRALLSKRDKKGKITDEFNAFIVKVDAEDLGELIDWAGAHALDFFLARLEKMKQTGEARKVRLEALRSTSSGGPA